MAKQDYGKDVFRLTVKGGAIGAGLDYFGKCSSGTCPLTANPYRGAIYGAVAGALPASAFSPKAKERPESSNVVHISSDYQERQRDKPPGRTAIQSQVCCLIGQVD